MFTQNPRVGGGIIAEYRFIPIECAGAFARFSPCRMVIVVDSLGVLTEHFGNVFNFNGGIVPPTILVVALMPCPIEHADIAR